MSHNNIEKQYYVKIYICI